MLQPSDTPGSIRFLSRGYGGDDAQGSSSTSLSTLPSTWSAGPTWNESGPASVYADLLPMDPPVPLPSPTSVPAATPTSTPTATPTATATSGPLPHDAGFVGPGYYAKWSKGPSTSMDYFPILTYHLNLNQWTQLAPRIKAAGINGVMMAYDQSNDAIFATAKANGLTMFGIQSSAQWHREAANTIDNVRANSEIATAYSVADEPNKDGSPYAMSKGTPSNDTGAQLYVSDANAQRAADPHRPILGNFTKDVEEWNNYGPSGWSTTQIEQHNRTMINALDIVSADVYAWIDEWEWQQGSGNTGTDHVGAWVYGHTIDRLRYYNPNVPAFGFVETTRSGDCNNTMMPGMLESAIWNLIVHGARGYTYWPRDFCGQGTQPYPGATFTREYSVFGDHLWDTQYTRMTQVNHTVTANARQINSPTVAGITATGQNGIPLSALGKDDNGKLWLLAQADGNAHNPMGNTTTMTGTITLPATIPAGTTFNVQNEHRTITVNANHQITDTFAPTTDTITSTGKPLTYGYAHHIYEQQ